MPSDRSMPDLQCDFCQHFRLYQPFLSNLLPRAQQLRQHQLDQVEILQIFADVVDSDGISYGYAIFCIISLGI